MIEYQKIKILGTFLLIAGVSLICATQAVAQQNEGSNRSESTANKSSNDLQNADVSITANVTARELKFEIVPTPKVEFLGKHERKTVWETDRQNLPDQVEPGVAYRNIGIQLRIVSRFADIERIVAEALGELPIKDDAPPQSAPPNVPPQNKSPKQ